MKNDDLFCGLFDFNQDGKTTFEEELLGLHILNTVGRNAEDADDADDLTECEDDPDDDLLDEDPDDDSDDEF